MSVIYGRPIVLSSGGGGGYVVSETEPEKTNVPNGLMKFHNGTEWVAVAGVYAEEEVTGE